MIKIYNFYRKKTKNTGDQCSTPLKYFKFKSAKTVEIDLCDELTDVFLKSLRAGMVIFGGGGLIANDYFEANIIKIINSHPKKVIWWGVGHNIHDKKEVGSLPKYLDQSDLVGIRDCGFKHEWVPCASCMNKLFDNKYPVTNEVVVYEHKHKPLNIKKYKKLNNHDGIEKVISFLGSANTIITNSYHGAYWGSLLGKKVLVVSPFSTKFHHFKNKIKIVDKFKKRHLDNLNCSPLFLSECRKANEIFFGKIKKLLLGS